MDAYTDEQLAFLKQLDDLPNGIDLTPEQAAIVLSVDTDWLRKKRQQSEGAGPPFRQLGDGEGDSKKPAIRYPLGLLRRWQAGRVFGNTHSAKLGIVGNFSAFLSFGLPTDRHPFVLDKFGRPNDWNLSDKTSSPIILSLEEFCDKLKSAAAAEFFAKEKDEIVIEGNFPNSDKETL